MKSRTTEGLEVEPHEFYTLPLQITNCYCVFGAKGITKLLAEITKSVVWEEGTAVL